jgi:anaerobic selenocysteine-containing dehydrogenase
MLQHSPSMAKLAGPAVMRVNPLDFERLGVGAGDDVKVSSARGSMTIRVEVDGAVPRGSATVAFNHDGVSASDLIDASSPVTDIRVETTR